MSDQFDRAREGGRQADGSDSCQFLTFTVDGAEYGVDIMGVREIKGWTETTRLPNAPDYMRGVMNLRGLIVPIFDMRCRFTQVATGADAKHVIIILAVGERHIGILVDSVSDILTLHQSEVKPAPPMKMHEGGGYVGGLISIDQRMVVVLTVDKLFSAKDIGENYPAATPNAA